MIKQLGRLPLNDRNEESSPTAGLVSGMLGIMLHGTHIQLVNVQDIGTLW